MGSSIKKERITVNPIAGWVIADMTQMDIAEAIGEAREAVKPMVALPPSQGKDDNEEAKNPEKLPYIDIVENTEFAKASFCKRVVEWPLNVELNRENASSFYERYSDYARSILKEASKQIAAIKKEELENLLSGADGTMHQEG